MHKTSILKTLDRCYLTCRNVAKKSIFLLLLITSCNHVNNSDEKSQPSLITLDLKSEFKSIHSLGLIKNISINHLEDSLPLGEISKVIQFEGLFYLLDTHEMSVSIYKENGAFINKIHKVGKAQDEYIQLVDIFVDPLSRKLHLVSRMDRKLFEYTLDGSRLINIGKLPTSYFKIVNIDEGYLGFLGNYMDRKNSSKNVSFLSKDLEIENSYFKINKAFSSYNDATVRPFSTYNNQTFYSQSTDYNIYAIGKNGYEAIYRFDFGEFNWPKDIRSLEQMDNMSSTEKARYVKNINLYQETSDHLIILFHHMGQKQLGVYNKNQRRMDIATFDAYTKDLFIPFGDIVGVDEKHIYTLVDAYRINTILRGSDEYNDFIAEYPKQIEAMRTLFDGIELNNQSNPFLITYSIQ